VNLNPPVLLAGCALLILGGIGAAMLVLPIPSANSQSVTFILGALAGALTMQGTAKGGPPANGAPDPDDTSLQEASDHVQFSR
jgi:hypothetical protein